MTGWQLAKIYYQKMTNLRARPIAKEINLSPTEQIPTALTVSIKKFHKKTRYNQTEQDKWNNQNNYFTISPPFIYKSKNWSLLLILQEQAEAEIIGSIK